MELKLEKTLKQVKVLIDNKLTSQGLNDRVLANSKTIAHLSSGQNKIATLSNKDIKIALPYQVKKEIPDNVVYVGYLVSEALKGTSTSWKVSLGCDPEFVLINKYNAVVNASRCLPVKGQIGSDGCLAELRPKPGMHEDEVVENLRALIKKVPNKIRGELTPEAHSEIDNNALGFHIHLGLPPAILSAKYSLAGFPQFYTSFVRMMDYFVGIPAMILEDNSRRRLGNGQYGKLKDFRRNDKTFEYRTPGGFYLRCPEYARGLMGLALCVGQEIINRAEEKSNSWLKINEANSFEFMQKEFGILTVPQLYDIFKHPDKTKALKEFPDIIKKLSKFSTFSEHKESIGSFIKCALEQKVASPKMLFNW